MADRLARSAVPEAETWNLNHIYPTVEAWEDSLAALDQELPVVTAFKGRLGEGAGVALACLAARDSLWERLSRLAALSHLRVAEDGTNTAYLALESRIGAMEARVDAALSFIESELADLPAETLEQYLAQEPGLEQYRHSFEQILKEKPHRLTPETEAVLAALGQTFRAPALIYNRAKAADLKFRPIRDAQGNEVPMSIARFGSYEQSPDREFRRRAWESLTEGLDAHKTTFASTLSSMITNKVVMAKQRRFGSAEELILHPQQIPLAVYNQVVDVILAEGAPHVRRYMKLRQRVLGLDQLHRYDMRAPLDEGYDPGITFAEGARLIEEALAPMGEEYLTIIRTALRDRWVDRADNVGKRTGAFCSPVYGVHPYVLMTWQDRMRDVFTLTHELGHAAHMALTQAHQPISNSGWSWFFVEAPSTASELLLGFHLLDRTTDKRMRRWIVLQFLGTFMHNFVTHMQEGDLERRLYRLAEAGKPITVQTLMQQQGQVFADYFQGTVSVDDGARLNWMNVGHYYTGLYPFTYS
ncbi:MAG TPA: M3 family metallopeptidase, partial [Symbiobacteriaceae bacterium]|nr:M3 family metallopeptidase [Symbiobacteriaceae bacterium]